MPDSLGYPEKLCLIMYELELQVLDFLKLLILICGFSAKVTCAFLAHNKDVIGTKYF